LLSQTSKVTLKIHQHKGIRKHYKDIFHATYILLYIRLDIHIMC